MNTNEVAVIPGLNPVANLDALDMDMIKQFADQSETGVESRSSIPKMIIFQGTAWNDCAYPEGAFIVGQTKATDGADKGKIVEQGKRVLAFTVLATRRQYNYYNEDDVKNSCGSNFFIDHRETITGHKHKQTCGKKGTCVYGKIDPATGKVPPKGCKCQIVLVGRAHCEDGSSVICRFYAKGSAFMPTSDFLSTGYKVMGGASTKTLQCYVAAVRLESTPEVNGKIRYFVPKYSLACVHDSSQWGSFLEDSKNAVDYFKMIDDSKAEETEGGQAQTGGTPMQPAQTVQGQGQTYQQPAQTYQQPAQTVQQPTQTYQQPAQHVQQPDQIYQTVQQPTQTVQQTGVFGGGQTEQAPAMEAELSSATNADIASRLNGILG